MAIHEKGFETRFSNVQVARRSDYSDYLESSIGFRGKSCAPLGNHRFMLKPGLWPPHGRRMSEAHAEITVYPRASGSRRSTTFEVGVTGGPLQIRATGILTSIEPCEWLC